MAIKCQALESPRATEIYITAEPSRPATTAAQATEVLSAVRDALRDADARILEERIFASEQAFKTIDPLRADLYGNLDDGVQPTRLIAPKSLGGDLAGIQVHAVRSVPKPAPLPHAASRFGRILRSDEFTWITLSGVSAAEAGSAPTQALRVYEAAAAALRDAGADMHAVARTWLWLGDILDWYGDFNDVRNEFYHREGLLNSHPGKGRMPASTGIGVKPLGAAICGLDLFAVIGPEGAIRYLQAAGNQKSPYKYGSAFSRAATTRTPAGETVFVSGTASIDAQGKTTHVGDARAQIDATVQNIRAVLADCGCGDSQVVQAIAYCKTPEVEKVWREMAPGVPWPCVTLLGDVCRDDLLFEIEAAACPGVRSL